MIGRRFLAYFLFFMVLLLVATVAFEWYALGKAGDQATQRNLLVARSVSRYVGGMLERDVQVLERALAEVPATIEDPSKVRAALAQRREATLSRAGIAVFDEQRRLLASDTEVAQLPPPDILLPALRQAAAVEGMLLTDMWRDGEDRPSVSIVISRVRDEVRRTALATLHVDQPEFMGLFAYFLIEDHAKLQLLDSRGIALYSTVLEERFKSVVHGTYLTDNVRLGKPVTMPCHSCHMDGDKEVIEQTHVITVAPVPDTTWSVALVESEEQLLSGVRDMAWTSIILVSCFFGAFIGFFWLLRRRVLTPMRQLADAVTGIAEGRREEPINLDADDEFTVLAESFETIRRRSAPRTDLQDEPHEPETPPAKPLVEPTAETLARTTAPVIDELMRLELVKSAALWLTGPALPDGFSAQRGVELQAEGDAFGRLTDDAPEQTWISLTDVPQRGLEVGDAGDTKSFHVRPLNVLDSLHGQLWIGVAAEDREGVRPFEPLLELLGAQVVSLLERNLLFERLRLEHERKDKMLHHLFEAEDAERKRIARDLHDAPVQVMTALLLALEMLPVNDESEEQKRALARARDMARDVIDELDRLIRRLRPAVLDDLGLVHAVASLGRNLLETSGVAFDLSVEDGGATLGLPEHIETAVYRVFQEAANNVVKHADATVVSASIIRASGQLVCVIEDDGDGMDLSWLDDVEARPRWGVLGMRERIAQLGGTIRFSSAVSGGLRIEFEVPVPAVEEAASEVPSVVSHRPG